MKRTLLSLLSLIVSSLAFAQYQGFENWSIESAPNLDGYGTNINEMGLLGQANCQQVASTVDGNFAVHLETTIIAGGDTMFGFIQNGSVEDQTPGQPVSLANVDSITGWYRYDIMPGDVATFAAITSMTGFGVTGGNVWYISSGTQSTWKRFAYYVNALAADSMLLAIATGDPINENNGLPGTWVEFDNIQLKDNSGNTMNVLNHSFEDWTDVEVEEPTGWTTSVEYAFNEPTSPVVKSTDAYSGMYALELNTIEADGDTIGGIATNGGFDDSGLLGGVPYTSEPNGVEFYYKYTPSGIDTGWASIQFKSGGSVILEGGTTLGAAPTYTLYSTPLLIPSTPDTLLIGAFSGENPGSQLIIDAIDLLFPVGINENLSVDRIVSYPNPATDVLNIKFTLSKSNNVSVRLLDITGKALETRNLGTLSSNSYKESFNTSGFASGAYFIEFLIGDEKTSNRFIVK